MTALQVRIYVAHIHQLLRSKYTHMNEPEPIKYSLKDIALIYLFILAVFIAICPLLYVHLAVEHGYGSEFASKISYIEKLKLSYFSPGGMMRLTLMGFYSLISLALLFLPFIKLKGYFSKIIYGVSFVFLPILLEDNLPHLIQYLGFRPGGKNPFSYLVLIPIRTYA